MKKTYLAPSIIAEGYMSCDIIASSLMNISDIGGGDWLNWDDMIS